MYNILTWSKIILILTDCQQNATSEGATGVNVAGSAQDPTLEVSPEKPSLLNTDLKPIALPPITCITPIGKCIINVMQTPGGKYNIVMWYLYNINSLHTGDQVFAVHLRNWPYVYIASCKKLRSNCSVFPVFYWTVHTWR